MPKDHLIRMSGRIHRHLSNQPAPAPSQWHSGVCELIVRLRRLDCDWQLTRRARDRGWHVAAAAKEREVLAETARITLTASRVANGPVQLQPQFNPPTLQTIVAELRQLKDEFEDFEIDLKRGLIGVTTEPIVLEDVALGRFTIDLHVNRLADRMGADCFKCIALEPNPAGGSGSTVHPHVQDGHLCAGDATLPISAALKEGRIADAFVLIRSVLQTYNGSSAYVELDDWSGQTCAECDDRTDSEYMYFCDGCNRDVCEECYSSCDICDEGCCRSCLETDNVSGNRCCAACRHTCGECDRTVDNDNYDEETELCPECLAKHKQELESEHEHESESTEPVISPVVPTTPETATPAAA